MTLTTEQSEEIKKQLISQLDKLPQENKEQIKQQVSQLNEEQLEEFLKQNKIQIQEGATQQEATPQTKCIFCSITGGQVPCYKIAEDKKAIAILEINPLTRGHVIIIPLEHLTIEELPKSSLSLAQKLAKKIKTKLKPEDIKIESSSLQGHAVINVVPLYKNEPPKKRKAEEQELGELQLVLQTRKRGLRKPREPRVKLAGSGSKLPKISFRIP